MLRSLVIAAATTSILGCSGVDVKTYQGERPELKLEEYLNGELTAWVVFQKRSGEVVRRFTVEIDADWSGNKGTLDERFTYSDGTTQRRVWTIINNGNGSYTGTADDVIGEAVGKTAGNALRWAYTLDLAVDDKNYKVDFDDWMYLMDDEVMINRSVMKKFGVKLGEVILFFRKKS